MNPILEYKERNDLSYGELAEKCKLDKGTLQRFATGKRELKNMTLETAEKICKAMNIDDPFTLIHHD